MHKIQEYLADFEAKARGLSEHDRKVMVQDYFVPLTEYIDYSFAHNGYRDVLEYFKKKERPRDLLHKKDLKILLNDDQQRKAAEINISGINMKNEQKNLDNDKSNLTSWPL